MITRIELIQNQPGDPLELRVKIQGRVFAKKLADRLAREHTGEWFNVVRDRVRPVPVGMTPDYVVHWTETDTFSGKVTHHWINAVGLKQATSTLTSVRSGHRKGNGAITYGKATVALIKDCPWHPSYRSQSVNNQPEGL